VAKLWLASITNISRNLFYSRLKALLYIEESYLSEKNRVLGGCASYHFIVDTPVEARDLNLSPKTLYNKPIQQPLAWAGKTKPQSITW
jgi:hypothetical protein